MQLSIELVAHFEAWTLQTEIWRIHCVNLPHLLCCDYRVPWMEYGHSISNKPMLSL